MTLMFCVEPGCVKPADGHVELLDIAGFITYDGKCREHVLAELISVGRAYRSSLVTVGWQGCGRCGGEGLVDGVVCPDCRELTEAGGPLRFGDLMHNGVNVGMYVGPADRDDLFSIALPQPTPLGWSMTAYHAFWSRCDITPCEHPDRPIEEENL